MVVKKHLSGGGFSAIICPLCHSGGAASLAITDFDRYFRGLKWTCPFCHESLSYWQLVRQMLLSENSLAPGAVAIGLGRASYGTLTLKRDKPQDLKLSEIGVPDDAKVLGVFLTPNGTGGLFPAFTLQSFTRASIPHDFYIHPLSMSGGSGPTEVSILCNWLSPTTDPEVIPLVNAVESYSTADYGNAVIPACVAVELKLYSVLHAHFMRFAGRKKSRTFSKIEPRFRVNCLRYCPRSCLPSILLHSRRR